MKRISNFYSFLNEDEAHWDENEEYEKWIQWQEKLKEDSDFLKSSINLKKASLSRRPFFDKTGAKFTVDINCEKIKSLLKSLEDGYYYVLPDFFEKHRDIKISFFNLDHTATKRSHEYPNLNPGEFEVGPIEVSSVYHLRLNAYINCQNYDNLLKSFNEVIKEVSRDLSQIRVYDYAHKQIPYKLSEEVKIKIKQIYQETVKDFFKTGEIDPEIISLGDMLADIFKTKGDMLDDFGPELTFLPQDLMQKIIRSLVDDDEKEAANSIKSLIELYSNLNKYGG